MSAEGNSEDLNVNDVLVKIGNSGKYQLWTFFSTALPIIFTALIHLQPVFTQHDMNFKCTEANWTDYQNQTNTTDECAIKFENSTELICTKFSYSSPLFTSTLMSEFDLVCYRKYLSTLSTTFYLAAAIPGAWIANVLSDRFGRKASFLVISFLAVVFGVIQIYSVNIVMYTIFRMLIILPVIGVYNSLAALVMEISAPSLRPKLLIGMIFFWAAGILGLSAVAYMFRDWKDLVLASTLPLGIITIPYFWIIDESPHWLYSRGEIGKAQVIIYKIARWNKFKGSPSEIVLRKQAPFKFDNEPPKTCCYSNSKKKGNESCCEVFKARRLLCLVAISAYLWVSVDMGYTGLSFSLGSLAGNIYVNNTIGGVVEVVSYFITFIVLATGRKKMFIALASFGAVGLIVAALVEYYKSEIRWMVICSTMVGRLSVSAGWQVLFMWSLEMYPTKLRLTLLSAAQTFGHAGSAFSMMISDAYKYIKNPAIAGKMIAPMTFGIMLAIGALLALLLPETRNKPLPITIKEANRRSVEANIDYDEDDSEEDIL